MILLENCISLHLENVSALCFRLIALCNRPDLTFPTFKTTFNVLVSVNHLLLILQTHHSQSIANKMDIILLGDNAACYVTFFKGKVTKKYQGRLASSIFCNCRRLKKPKHWLLPSL